MPLFDDALSPDLPKEKRIDAWQPGRLSTQFVGQMANQLSGTNERATFSASVWRCRISGKSSDS